MSPDDVLAFLFDNSLPVFGLAIAAALAVMVRVGRPRRWWGWLLDTGAVAAIGVSILGLWFFASIASAMDRRLDSLTVTPLGETRAHRLSDYRGKVVFLNYWATWCGPCRHEIPAINQLTSQWRGRDVVFLAVTDEDTAAVEKFLAKIPIEATVATFRSRAPKGDIETMCYSGRPTTLILDAEGRVRRRFIGARDYQEFNEALTRAAKAATSRG
jgi:thiol-disulfide isomerase/thioredoxin